jgi:hypothetical protein
MKVCVKVRAIDEVSVALLNLMVKYDGSDFSWFPVLAVGGLYSWYLNITSSESNWLCLEGAPKRSQSTP